MVNAIQLSDSNNNLVNVTSGKLDVDAHISSEDISIVRPGEIIFNHLDNAGSDAMNIDGSVTPVVFSLTPPVGKKYIITGMSFYAKDSAMEHSVFAGLPSALTNGLLVKFKESGVERQFYEPIKENSHFFLLSQHVDISSANDDLLIAHILFENFRSVLELKNSTGDSISVTVQDDLSTINTFEAHAFGYMVTE